LTETAVLRVNYCFWSVARGAEERSQMLHCVRTARDVGVFKEFHVLTDAPIQACECYEAHDPEDRCGLHKLIYLKAAISRLPFDYFVWVEPSTIFLSAPLHLVGALSRSPIHVPLEVELSKVGPAKEVCRISAERYGAIMAQNGVRNPIYLNGSAFWIVAHDAVDAICDVAMHGWHKAKDCGAVLDASFALGYAMQMLCADPRKHTVEARPDLWAADYRGVAEIVTDTWWEFEDRTGTSRFPVRPSLVHQPQRELACDQERPEAARSGVGAEIDAVELTVSPPIA